MDVDLKEFHDFELLSFEKKSNNLKIKISSHTQVVTLIFYDIYDYLIENFTPQNIIFDFVKYSLCDKELIFNDFEADYINKIPEGFFIFKLDSSVGAYGFIISKGVMRE